MTLPQILTPQKKNIKVLRLYTHLEIGQFFLFPSEIRADFCYNTPQKKNTRSKPKVPTGSLTLRIVPFMEKGGGGGGGCGSRYLGAGIQGIYSFGADPGI